MRFLQTLFGQRPVVSVIRGAVLVLAPLAVVAGAHAAPAVSRLSVFPKAVRLSGARDGRQLVLTGVSAGRPVDRTHAARWVSRNPKVAKVVAGRIVPVGDGATEVVAVDGAARVAIPVTVVAARRKDPIDFHREVIPVLTKQGCAGGSCHGSPQGKGGFSLSLFGYDPSIDRISLTRDAGNRRVDRFAPDQSLLLRKPRLKVPHVGGRRLRPGDAAFPILRGWIAEGARAEAEGVACVALEVAPGEGRVLAAPGRSQQLAVTARFADGTTRDVTRIAHFESSHPGVAEVDPRGKVTGTGRGQAAISVRYLQHLESVQMTVLAPVPRFIWKPVPEFNAIDRVVNQRLRLFRVTAAPTCDDATFLRRVSLDLAGLTPSADEVRAFLAERSADKRARKIDQLLDGDAFARHWAQRSADLMRVSDQRLPGGRADQLARWLAEGWKRNQPWDAVARELLTASGDTRQVAPANFLVAIATPEDRTEMTSQIFLGSRVQCAKCHNHPYEKWTMNDYYAISASFARTTSDGWNVRDTAAGETEHPVRKTKMAPWGAAPGEEPTSRRAAFADWLVAKDNPLFAKVEANRIWAGLTGRGIVEPVDDFRSSNPPTNPALLELLARRFRDSGHDRKDLIRFICNSQTYQRASRVDAFNAGDDMWFSHARPRLLTAEQLQDAVGMTTGVLDPPAANEAAIGTLAQRVERRREERLAADRARVAALATRVAALDWRAGGWRIAGPWPMDAAVAVEESEWRAWPLRDGEDRILGGPSPVRWRLRRTFTARVATEAMVEIDPRDHADVRLDGVAVPRGRDAQRTLRLAPGTHVLEIDLRLPYPNQAFRFRLPEGANAGLSGEVVEALSAGAAPDAPALRQLLDTEDPGTAGMLAEAKVRARWDEYATQRGVPAPSPFLAAFGQPKRETACACERQNAPTLLQALELLNGEETYRRLRDGADALAALPDAALLETLALRAFGRTPDKAERDVAAGFLGKRANRRDAVIDLAWALMSTREFLFQH